MVLIHLGMKFSEDIMGVMAGVLMNRDMQIRYLSIWNIIYHNSVDREGSYEK